MRDGKYNYTDSHHHDDGVDFGLTNCSIL